MSHHAAKPRVDAAVCQVQHIRGGQTDRGGTEIERQELNMERKQQAGCPAEEAGERRGVGGETGSELVDGPADRQTDRFREDRGSGEADGRVR